MIYKLFLPICIVLGVGVVQINGQLCSPLPVQNLTISLDAQLSWDPNPNESCNIIYHLVYIDSSVNNEYVYAVANTSLNVPFLPVCDSYIFRVVSVSSDNLDSTETRLATKIPLPANANLTVASLKVTPQEEEAVLLEWNLEEDWEKCADRFRVVVYDEDLDFPQDIYTYTNSLQIPGLAPCTPYEFGVIAIYSWEIEGPITVVSYSTPPQEMLPPTLSSIALGNTYVNITWALEPYVRNKCAITEAYIEVRDVTQSFNLTQPVLDQTDRRPLTISVPNLRADNLYFVNTTIVNVAGPSTPVILVVQTRP